MPASENAVSPSRRYAVNVAWTGLGAFGNFLNMALVSPIVIRRLGPEGYGVWALLFSLVSYSVFMDLGVRPALSYFTAYWTARNQQKKSYDLLNSVLAYYLVCGAALTLASIAISRYAPGWFNVSPAFHDDFQTLISLIGGLTFLGLNPFVACMEGMQRFDRTVKIYVMTLLLRVVGSLSLLALGFGIVALAVNYMCVQIFGMTLALISYRRLAPSYRLKPSFRGLSQIREVTSYASDSFLVSLATIVLTQSGALVIGYLMSATSAGFFSLPQRLMQYSGDIVVRAGNVTTATSVEIAETSDWKKLMRMGALANRLGFVLYMPILIFLGCFAEPFLRLWVGPEFAEQSTPLILILVGAGAVAIGGQFQSSAILFALRLQRHYGAALMLEAALSVIAMFILVPRYGLLGGAFAIAIPMLVFRAGYVPWSLCRRLDHSLPRYWFSIYAYPAAAAIPIWLLARLIPTPQTWFGMVAAGVSITAAYGGCAWFLCLAPYQRERITAAAWGAAGRLRRSEPAVEVR